MGWISEIATAAEKIVQLWKWWKSRSDPIYTLPTRVLRCFEAHGVMKTQIPRMLESNSAKLVDLQSPDHLLSKLDDGLLEQISEKFGISRQWFDGASESIYPRRSFYKDFEGLTQWLIDLKALGRSVDYIVLKPAELDPSNTEGVDCSLCVVFRMAIADFGEKAIYRYIPMTEEYPWGHPPARLYLKGLALICWQLSMFPRCYDAPASVIRDIASGSVFPEEKIAKHAIIRWHLDDYIFTSAQSLQALDELEAAQVQTMLREQGVLRLLKQEEFSLKPHAGLSHES